MGITQSWNSSTASPSRPWRSVSWMTLGEGLQHHRRGRQRQREADHHCEPPRLAEQHGDRTDHQRAEQDTGAAQPEDRLAQLHRRAGGVRARSRRAGDHPDSAKWRMASASVMSARPHGPIATSHQVAKHRTGAARRARIATTEASRSRAMRISMSESVTGAQPGKLSTVAADSAAVRCAGYAASLQWIVALMAKVFPTVGASSRRRARRSAKSKHWACLPPPCPTTHTIYHSVHWTCLEQGFSIYGDVDFAVVNRAETFSSSSRRAVSSMKGRMVSASVKRGAASRWQPTISRVLHVLGGKLSQRLGDEQVRLEYPFLLPDYHIREPRPRGWRRRASSMPRVAIDSRR